MTVPPEAMKHRKRRPLRILFVLVALYAAVGFFAVPPLVKWQLEKRLPELLGRPVSVGQVRTNPFALSVALNRVVVRVPDGSANLVQWERFYVNFDPLASITREWVLGDVALAGLDAAIEVQPDGSLSVSDLIEKFRRPPEPGETPRAPAEARPWRIRRLNISDARLAFADRSRAEPFATAIGPVNLAVLDFRTAGARGAPGRFEAVSDAGEKIAWVGTLTAAPLTSTGELRLENVQLPKYGPYLADRLRGKIGSGRLSVNANYEVDLSPGSRRIAITGGAAQLTEFRLADADGEPLGELTSLQVTGLVADALAPRLAVEAIRLEGGRLTVRRAADGALNVLELLPRDPEAAAAPTAPGPLPDVKVKEISLRDFAVSVRDLAAPRPVEAEFTRINGTLKDATLAAGATMPLDLSFDWAPRGAVRVSGNLMREPLLADLNLEVAWLALPPLSPYLESAAAARIDRGVVSLSGRARVEQAAAGGAFGAAFTGGGRVEDFSLVAADGGEELAGVDEFSLDDVKLATQPRLSLSIAGASLGGPRAHAVRDEQGVLNFSRLRPAAEGGAAGAEESGAGAEVTVSRVLIAAGEFTFEDRSTQPRVRTALTQVSGTLRNFSSQQPEQGSVELRGMVDGGAPVSVIGRLNPLGVQPFADLIVEGKAIDLAPAAPYVSQFAGYELESGRLAFDVKAKLANDALDMRNTITLERFALGQATPGPDAVKLPVKLGVALLKDADGRIVLQLPVQGSLSDPQFDVGAVVGDVFTGLLTKAATSPFALLGSMFGGGGEELAQQEWVPGEPTLTEESVRRLVTVQRALAARPALKVEIEAMYHPRDDAQAMKRVKLEELLRRELVRESRGREPTTQARANAIRTVFGEMFPGGVSQAEIARHAAAEPSASAPADEAGRREEVEATPMRQEETGEERRGILGRAMDLATLKGPRTWWSERRERKEAAERQAEIAREDASRAATRQRAEAAAQAGVQLELSVEEMERHLADTIAVTEQDLAALAQARGERVRELLLADGAVAPERVTVGATKAVEGNASGARSVLHLR